MLNGMPMTCSTPETLPCNGSDGTPSAVQIRHQPAARAASRADCRLWMYAALVYDAPLTVSIWAEPAARASRRRIGAA